MHYELKKHGIIMSLDEDIGICFITSKVTDSDVPSSVISDPRIESSIPNTSSAVDSYSKSKLTSSIASLTSEEKGMMNICATDGL